MKLYICRTNELIMAKKNKGITLVMLKKLQKELKGYNKNWSELLIEEMIIDNSLDDEYKDVNRSKIYNVFNNVVREGAWRLIVYKYGQQLKERLEKEIKEVIS